MKPKVLGLAVVLLVMAAAAFVSVSFRDNSQSQSPVVLELQGKTMGTTYSIKIVGEDFRAEQLESIERAVEEELESVNRSMSRYRKDSDISSLNNMKDSTPVSMSADALELLAYAVELSAKTDGAFDVTVGPLIELWGFHAKKPLPEAPLEESIQRARAIAGYDKIVIDAAAGTVSKVDSGVDVDLSSIAKGRGVDQVARALVGLKFSNFMVEIGGEVRAKGLSGRGTPWRVGIEKPNGGKQEIFDVVELVDMSMATSGDYRSFFKLQGKRYSHTIDPRTGRPIQHNLASVTVVHNECMKADAIATALTVLGPDEGFALAEKEVWAAFFITRDEDDTFDTKATGAFKKL